MLTLLLAPVAVATDAALMAVDAALAVVCAPIERGPGARLVDRGWEALASRLVI